MNVYFTEPGLRQFKSKFKRDAGWSINREMFRRDTVKDSAAVTVSMCDEEPPTWVEMVISTDSTHGGTGMGTVQLRRSGPVGDVMADPSRHGLYRGTGIFRATYNVVSNSRGCCVSNLMYKRDEALQGGTPLRGRLALQLVGVRVFGRDDQIQRVAFGKKRGLSSI